jgi:prolyl-tRNA editing enzyme YbaK/EbsC (Cys-tRNA(Pro) deacylase)
MDASDIEARVRTVLEASGHPYEVIDCDPDFADTTEFCEVYGYPLDRSANTIVVASKRPPGHVAACVVLATTRLDVNRRVRDVLDVRKVSFASADVTRDLTGMLIGGVTPFALPASIPVLIDERVLVPDWVIVGSGSRTSKLKVHPSVLASLPGGRVINGLAVSLDG